jgi:hypothetical protein
LKKGIYIINTYEHVSSPDEVQVVDISPDGKFLKFQKTSAYSTSEWKEISKIQKLSTLSEPEYKTEYVTVRKPRLRALSSLPETLPEVVPVKEKLSAFQRFVRWFRNLMT